jgi:hypothetical protein
MKRKPKPIVKWDKEFIKPYRKEFDPKFLDKIKEGWEEFTCAVEDFFAYGNGYVLAGIILAIAMLINMYNAFN